MVLIWFNYLEMLRNGNILLVLTRKRIEVFFWGGERTEPHVIHSLVAEFHALMKL